MEKGLMVKDVPVEERPRERMINFGASYLTNADLLAILLRTGSQQESVMGLANRILAKVENFRNLADISIEELCEIKGIGPAKAIQILAGIELGRRLSRLQPEDRTTIRSPQDAADLLMEEMKYLTKEYFIVLFLNTKNHVIGKETISVGSLNSSIVHPREIFKSAIRRSAASVICAHNHPSGDPTPSREDIDVTKRLHEAGTLLGIDVLDHIVIGDERFYSLKEKGLI